MQARATKSSPEARPSFELGRSATTPPFPGVPQHRTGFEGIPHLAAPDMLLSPPPTAAGSPKVCRRGGGGDWRPQPPCAMFPPAPPFSQRDLQFDVFSSHKQQHTCVPWLTEVVRVPVSNALPPPVAAVLLPLLLPLLPLSSPAQSPSTASSRVLSPLGPHAPAGGASFKRNVPLFGRSYADGWDGQIFFGGGEGGR